MSVGHLQKPPFRLRVMHVVRWYIGVIVRFVCSIYYGKSGERIPPICDDVLKLPAFEVAKKIRHKEISSVEVLEACMRRIKDVNSALNCFIENRFESALKEARNADELISSGTKTTVELEKEKPLLGVPFTTKDCIAVKGLHHTAGVVLRKDVIAEEDAEVIRLLRDKGAIMIGLTNVPELCMWWETHNHIYGRTKNPYNTTRIVGGSSGGEGCLQTVGGSLFGIGSDIGGSIRMPAFFNGIFGHKPSRHIVSHDGQYPSPKTELQKALLSAGPMTKHSADLKPLLKIISGDNIKLLNLDEPVDMSKLKVYYQFSNNVPMADDVEPEIVAAMKKVLEFMTVKYKLKSEEKDISLLSFSMPLWFTSMKSEIPFSQLIMKKDDMGTICLEILKNSIGCSGNTLIGLLTCLIDFGGVEIGSDKYKHYLKLRDKLEEMFTEMLGDDGIFIFPTHPTAAPYHNEPLCKSMNFSYTAIINCLGLPATNVPLGLNKEGLPIGIQIVANHYNDRLCLAVAEELDKAFGGWREPQHST